MKILIFTINPVHNAPRVIREINALKSDYEIVVTGSTAPTDTTIAYINSDWIKFSHVEYTLGKIYRVLSLGRVFKGRYWTTQMKINKLLKDTQPDVVIVHPAAYLPYFFVENRNFKIVFNAHEYHPREIDNDLKWEKTWGVIYTEIYKRYLPKLALLINVNQEIADQCENYFGVKSLVIPNASSYHVSNKKKWEYKLPIRFIHHGIPNPDRKLEEMIEAFKLLGPSFEFDLMLMNNGSEYYKFLQNMVESLPNVRIIPPVPFLEIIPYISKYDLGLYSLAPTSFNNQMALPNKFFEFIQARLPVVIGPSPVMERYVKKFDIGKIARNFDSLSLADTIKSLTEHDLTLYRDNLEIAAKELSMEQFESELVEKIKELH